MTTPLSRGGRDRTLLRVAVTFAVLAVPLIASGAPAAAAPAPRVGPLVPLAGTATPLPAGATDLGSAVGPAQVTADVVLRPRDPSSLAAFAEAVSTPGSSSYRQYLPAGRLAADFGPTASILAATRSWLAGRGLTVGPTSGNGLLIPVSGTAARMQSALAVPLVRARLAGGRVVRLATRDAEVPSGLAPDLQGVLGLSTDVVEAPHLDRAVPAARPAPRASVAGPSGAVAAPQACPAAAEEEIFGGRTATQLAATYGFDPLYAGGRTGAGRTIGIFELEPYSASDIATFESCFDLHVPVTTVDVDGGPGTDDQSGEAALDIEVAAGMAPGASIDVYTGPNDGANGPIDTYTRMVDADAAQVLTTSWGQCEPLFGSQAGRAQQQAENTVFMEAAAQGQTVLAAAGDSGSSDCYDQDGSRNLAVDDPADQPYVVGVGGTTLLDAAANSPTEQVWNGIIGSHSVSGGGGDSSVFEAPGWQQIPAAQSGSTTYDCGPSSSSQCREVPDVSASADPNYGDIVYFGGWGPVGGTSAASPLWAALVVDADQGCTSPAPLDSSIYSSTASSDFNDVTVGDNDLFGESATYSAAAGYDLASGWGSPRADALLGILSGSAAGCPSVTGLSPSSGAADGGYDVTVAGSGFGTGTPTVAFGATQAVVVSHSATSVTVVAPDVRYGARVPVTVTTTSGSSPGTSPPVPSGEFTFVAPEVTSVAADRGPVTGGATVTVEGSDLTGTTAVDFGSRAAANVDVLSADTLTATVPPGPASGATVHVVVTSASGISSSVAADRYTYALPGYWLTASDGGIFAFGHAGFYGSTGGLTLARPIVGMAAAPDDHGYWLAASDGGIFAFGDAGFYGSTGGLTLNQPIVGMAATHDGQGYWLAASDGGIFAFGDAGFYGSTGAIALNRPIVGMAPTADGKGYWLVASDGGIFAFGDAGFYGSTGAIALNRPIVGMAPTADGKGYWLVASDGGIFAFGDAGFHGSTGAIALNRPIVGMSVDLTGDGYWLVASDGGIFAYGDAPFEGSAGALVLDRPISGMAGT